jgi:hypothetical protein
LVLALLSFSAYSQEQPPRPLQVSTFQNLSFGAVIQGGTGGIITIDPQGSRTVSGSIIPYNSGYPHFPAVFDVEAIPGTLVTILNGPDILLTGNNGGTLSLHIGTSIPTSPFVAAKVPPFRTSVRIGGTLTVGNSIANPSGNYIGFFEVTFIQQ